MARSYQYGTSPRKIEPDYRPRKKTTKKDIRKEKIIKENEEQQKINNLNAEKRKHHKNIAMIVGVFLILLVISYRNSLITERFNEIQDKKSELSAIEKTNGQLEVSIESSLNLNNIEKEAKKSLGMNKLSNNQKVFVSLPKKDYIESSTESVKIEEESSWFQSLINKIFK